MKWLLTQSNYLKVLQNFPLSFNFSIFSIRLQRILIRELFIVHFIYSLSYPDFLLNNS